MFEDFKSPGKAPLMPYSSIDAADSLIAKIVKHANEGDFVFISSSNTQDDESFIQNKGCIRIPRGLDDVYFASSVTREGAEEQGTNAYVLLLDYTLDGIDQILPLLEKLVDGGSPVLVIARYITGESRATLLLNKMRHIVNFVGVSIGAQPEDDRLFDQICSTLKTQPFSENALFSNVKLQDLPKVEFFCVSECELVLAGKDLLSSDHCVFVNLPANAQNLFEEIERSLPKRYKIEHESELVSLSDDNLKALARRALDLSEKRSPIIRGHRAAFGQAEVTKSVGIYHLPSKETQFIRGESQLCSSPNVLVVNDSLDNPSSIAGISNILQKHNAAPLIIVCKSISNASAVALKEQNNSSVDLLVITPPSSWPSEKSYFEDVAALSGAKIIDPENGDSLYVDLDGHLGAFDLAVLTSTYVILIPNEDRVAQYELYVSQISAQSQNAPEFEDRHNERLASLADGIVQVHLVATIDEERLSTLIPIQGLNVFNALYSPRG